MNDLLLTNETQTDLIATFVMIIATFVMISFALLIIIAAFLRSPKGKGIIGELRVKIFLGKNKIDERYVINNVTVEYDGKSSQIDHVLICRTGIFVIETKNYAGYIYGNEKQKEWTQVLSFGKVKNKFYNPILQNNTHIYALSKILNFKDCFVSIIVFPKATLKTDTTTSVGNIRNMKNTYKKKRDIIFTVEELNNVYHMLIDYKNNPRVSNKEHVKSIYDMKEKIDSNICPRCGNELVLKESKYGNFYGCSDYPKCRFKKTKSFTK